MGLHEDIREALFNLAAKVGPRPSLLATVKRVDEDKMTCTLEDDDGVEFYQVRLRPVLDGKEALTIFPKPGAWALALRVENDDDWVIVATGEADKWRLKIAETVLEQDKSGLLVQQGEDSLLQVIELIIEAAMGIVVVQGRNPDYVKLQQALTKVKKILR